MAPDGLPSHQNQKRAASQNATPTSFRPSSSTHASLPVHPTPPMTSSLKQLLTDGTTYATLFTAVCTAGYAAYRANDPLLKQRARSSSPTQPSLTDQLIDENSHILQGPIALAFPVIATLCIIFLFFFLGTIGAILTALSTISGFFSLLFLLWPLAESALSKLRSLGLHLRTGGYIEAILLVPVVTCVMLMWLCTGHWVLNNLIGISLCILFASLCKVPSLKVNAVLFVGLFLYDIFFVFFSKHIFGRNVMVQVATSTPTNPASAIASFLHLPFQPVKKLALPAKLVFPAGHGHQSILGLGDIILPEVLLVYLLEFDLRSRGSFVFSGYFGRALVAYAVGLFASFYCSYTFKAAQPALLYIVPAMIIPIVLMARNRGQLGQIWKGVQRMDMATLRDEPQHVPDKALNEEESGALLT